MGKACQFKLVINFSLTCVSVTFQSGGGCGQSLEAAADIFASTVVSFESTHNSLVKVLLCESPFSEQWMIWRRVNDCG